MNLTVRILIGMAAGIVVGLVLQTLAPADGSFLKIYLIDGLLDAGGALFLKSLKLMVVPLVFVSLVCGASALGSGSDVGRIGAKTIGLYLMTTAIAVSLALMVALFVSPGEGANAVPSSDFVAKEAPPIKETLLNIVPDNPVAAMAQGNMLQIIVFALLVGIAIARAGSAGERVRTFFNDLSDVLMVLIGILIKLAPYGVFCLMSLLFVRVGWEQIGNLLQYFFSVVATLLLHGILVYSSLLVLLARVNPLLFFGKMREALLVAFSTSSSGATLPVTLRAVEHRLGVNNKVASFVVPLGATINMDGTAIMQGVATVFIAQFYGFDLSASQLLMVVLTATLASIGTAAVPGVGLIMLSMVLTEVGLPLEGVALIIGVDRLLDMMRTAVNVSGDATVATVIARSEGLIDDEILADPQAGALYEER